MSGFCVAELITDAQRNRGGDLLNLSVGEDSEPPDQMGPRNRLHLQGIRAGILDQTVVRRCGEKDNQENSAKTCFQSVTGTTMHSGKRPTSGMFITTAGRSF